MLLEVQFLNLFTYLQYVSTVVCTTWGRESSVNMQVSIYESRYILSSSADFLFYFQTQALLQTRGSLMILLGWTSELWGVTFLCSPNTRGPDVWHYSQLVFSHLGCNLRSPCFAQSACYWQNKLLNPSSFLSLTILAPLQLRIQ